MTNFKDTVFLPKTSLPTKTKPEAELGILNSWYEGAANLYSRLRSRQKGKTPWVLTDGPPYANGNIHIGHAMNKTLKDILVRGHNALGMDAPFVPGWDCHGLPIEWKVEEQWRRDKKDKAADPKGFRADCRAFAAKWIETQKAEFKRLGILADWDAPNFPMGTGPYTTMTLESESAILHTFHDLVARGLVYRANKPVMWSPVERTALADAETVDRTHTVPHIWMNFRVLEGPYSDAEIVVWTTTPWSVPANVGVAMNSKISYGVYLKGDKRYLVADTLAEQALGEKYARINDVHPQLLVGSKIKHPLSNLGYPMSNGYCLIVDADFVRDTSGTGFVHIGPSHSTDDWLTWRKTGLEFPNPVMDNGKYASDVPEFAGMNVTKGKKMGEANDAIVEALERCGTLHRVLPSDLTLQHSWRSDAVLITRATPQVFIDLDKAKVDAAALIENVSFNPPHAKARMISMMVNRPDWLVSRQRLWGTPLAVFVHKGSGEICTDAGVLGSIHQTLMDNGSEEWFDLTVEDILQFHPEFDANDWERLDDVLDVWFDSGCVQIFTNATPDLVVEGHDQLK